MSYIRESVVDTIPHDDLLRLVKANLDALGIPYQEKPGGFGPGPILDPSIFETEDFTEQFVLAEYTTKVSDYCPPQVNKCTTVSVSSSDFGEYNIQFPVAA